MDDDIRSLLVRARNLLSQPLSWDASTRPARIRLYEDIVARLEQQRRSDAFDTLPDDYEVN